MTESRQDSIHRLTNAFDFHDPAYTPDVAEVVNREMRERNPVAYSPAHGGMWIVSRYEDVQAVLRDHETFSSGAGVHFPRAKGMPMFSPIDYDPPEHSDIRRLMAPPVGKEAVRRLEPSFRELAAELVSPLAERGHGDVVAELARPFAIRTLGATIGLSEDAQREIRELTRNMWLLLSREDDSSGFWPQYRELLSSEIQKARASSEDSYLAWLARAEVDGEPISEELLYSIVVSYCVAGHDNTMNTLSRMLWHLARSPDTQRRLREEPELMPVAAEETLRRWSPTDRFTRVTTRDVTLRGVTIPAHSRVVLLFDAANRDPEVFPDPEEFRLDRGNSHKHLSLGHGIHRCLGAHVARLEFTCVLEELARHPVYRLVTEPRCVFENGRHTMFEEIRVSFADTAAAAPGGDA
ncbi:cytochrome P450 [Haloactinospora alba]|uniref:Cytochrome P450 n=1 Tax=Haloactinospora alba TaxID=405555 RepID=A0A543N972_9ACTN|nr:cytochrome P450 [Haloactinospora alba]TQN28386.1 cytochrome P450 [Haloactinospora alba]